MSDTAIAVVGVAIGALLTAAGWILVVNHQLKRAGQHQHGFGESHVLG